MREIPLASATFPKGRAPVIALSKRGGMNPNRLVSGAIKLSLLPEFGLVRLRQGEQAVLIPVARFDSLTEEPAAAKKSGQPKTA